jgi:predicted ATPase
MMMNSIAQYLVKAFLQCTIACDLVVLAIDDVSQMDTMSWNVVELLHKNAQNLMIVGTTRPLTQKQRIHASPHWWESLHNMDKSNKEFVEMELSPMNHSDVEALIASRLGRMGSEIDPRISHEVFVQSGGMPLLASEILENLYKKEMQDKWENGSASENIEALQSPGLDVGNIGELVLHRMDSLPASVRTHLNLGAILGSSFELMDVVTVFEQYRGVKKEERLAHAKSVHESLDEAVRKGILEVVDSDSDPRYGSSDHPYTNHNVAYKFTLDVWRSNILRLTLDEWKRDMHSLIAQSMETAMNSEFADDYRLLNKLFCHWKESGSAEKAATLALKIGRSLESIGLTRQGLVVYHESLDMWKAMDNNDEPDESIGGKSCKEPIDA